MLPVNSFRYGRSLRASLINLVTINIPPLMELGSR